jgi:tetratricopeptide (TPR) repeat protein
MSPRRDADNKKWQAPLICGVLALLTAAVYWQTLRFDFVNYDDGDYVIGNKAIQSGLTAESVKWAFTTGHASNWHPLTWLSHELDCQIFGVKPGGMHLTNLIFHVANTLLLFGVLRKMTAATWRSAIVAALFGWHPTHVESVAWISERKDVLSTFFWLLTLLAYAKYASEFEVSGSKFKVYYVLTLGLFAMGLMSKPMLVTLPFVLLLMDYWPLKRIADWGLGIADSKDAKAVALPTITWPRAVWEKVPFLLLAVASSVVTFMAQRKGGAVATLHGMPTGARISNAIVSYLRYAGKLLWPENLSVLYPMPPSWPVWLVVMAAVFLTAVSAMAVWQARQRPYFFAGWFWFAGTLVPVIGLVQVGVQSMADRYLYVPSIGLFIAATWGAAELTERRPKRNELFSAGAGIMLAVCLSLTWFQIRIWRDGETLFRHAVAVTKNNYLAYNNLGFFLENHGKTDEALDDYRKSVEINPFYEDARNNLGHLLRAAGKYDEALIHLQEALRIKPGLVEAHNNLGNLLGDLGRRDEAIAQYELALQYDSNNADAHNNLGVSRAMQGRLDEAEKLLKQAVRLNPADVGAHGNLGNVLALEHKPDEALGEYELALKLNPGDAQTHYNLGNVLLEKSKWSEAADQYAAAIQYRPKNPDAQYKLGLALAAQSKRGEAITHFREALRFNPNYPDAQRRIDELSGGK